MTWLKRTAPAQASPDAAADVRLRSIAMRGKAESLSYSSDHAAEPVPATAAAPRLFWTPDEALALQL